MKKITSLLLTVLMLVCLCVPAGALNVETVETVSETAGLTEQSGAEFASDMIVPGKNLINGTTEPETFDTWDISNSVIAKEGNSNTFKVGASPEGTDHAADNSLIIGDKAAAGNQRYPVYRIAANMEKGRKYSIAFNMFSDINTTETAFLWILGYNGTKYDVFASLGNDLRAAVRENKWYYYVNKEALWDNGFVDSPFLKIQVQTNKNANTPQYYWYLDDVLVIPYYKITYIGLDGETVAATDYALYGADGEFLTSYTPDLSKVPGAHGYSLTHGGDRVTSVPLANEDITLYAFQTQKLVFEGKEYDITGDSFTIPTPEETGAQTENFLLWIGSNGEKYRAGEVITGDELIGLIGLTFTAVCQDVSQPAMGMAFEGTAKDNFNVSAVSAAKFSYTEYMQDDGRSVYHAHAYKWKDAANTDARIAVNAAAPFDSSEYNILKYTYKINTLQDKNLTDVEKAEMKIFYNNGTGSGGYWCGKTDGCPGEHIPAKRYYVSVTENYQTVEIDMGLAENNVSGHGWSVGKTISQLHIDPAKIQVSGVQDTCIDSVRVYRDGVFTVTYDTNIPDGADEFVQSEVAADTGRGVGTGYLLTDEQPVITSYTFRGWALTPDAAPEKTVTSVNLTGDLTVYAVWSETPAYPNAANEASIRSGADNINGLRFYATVYAATREELEEYGFIVALEETLGDNELTFDFKNHADGKPLYASGKAYNKSENLDRQFDINESGDITFTAVCTGIPENGYNKRIVARPYAVILNNGYRFTAYGDAVTFSLAEAAASIRDAAGDEYAANKDYIDSILG